MRGQVGLTLCFLVAQLLTTRLSALDQQVVSDRVKRLESMSKSEREQFDRSVDEFEQMPADERGRIVQLHEGLISDRRGNGGLTNLLQTYNDWLDTLTPIQRDELQREKVTAKKIALIRKLKEDQDRKSKEDDDRPTESPDRANEEFQSFIRRRIDQPYGFDITDLTAALKAIVNDLPAEKRQPGFDAPQLNQFTQIIHAHAQWKQSYRLWPDEDTLGKIAKAVRPKTAELIKHSNAMQETPRETAVRLLLMGIVKQADFSLKMSNEDREKALNSLKPAERRRVEGLSVDKRNQLLRKRFFEAYDDQAYQRAQQIRKDVIDLFQQTEVKIPPLLERFKKSLEKNLQGKG